MFSVIVVSGFLFSRPAAADKKSIFLTEFEPVEHDYFLKSSWQVREDDDEDYEVFSIDDSVPETPLELATKVSAKLNRVVALAELLKNAQCPPKRTINTTLYVITGLIEEAVEDNENLRAKLLDQGPPRYG